MTFESSRRRGVLPVISSRGSEWWSWCRGSWQPNRFSLCPCVLSLLHPIKTMNGLRNKARVRGLYAVQSSVWLETMRCYTKIKGVPLFEGTEVKWNSICNLKLHKLREGQGHFSVVTWQFVFTNSILLRIKFLLAANPLQSYICLWTRSGKRRDWQTTKSTVATEVSSDDVQNEIAFFRDKQKCVCSRWQRRGAYLGYSERGWNTHATHVTKHWLNLGTNLYFECMSHKAEQYKCINTSIKMLHF